MTTDRDRKVLMSVRGRWTAMTRRRRRDNDREKLMREAFWNMDSTPDPMPDSQEAQTAYETKRRQVYRENQLWAQPRQLAALSAIMLDNEEELDKILEELPVHDLGRLLIYCERLEQAVTSKRRERLHGTPQG